MQWEKFVKLTPSKATRGQSYKLFKKAEGSQVGLPYIVLVQHQAIRFAVRLRRLKSLGLARSVCAAAVTLNGVASIQTGSGGEGSSPISSLKN